jgi:hypothetical protein
MSYTVKDLTARGIEPTMLLLLDRVQKRATVNYGEIARMLPPKLGITRVFSTHIGKVAGELMDRIHARYTNVPLINLLVVNQGTGLPGEGCNWYLDQLLEVPSGTAKNMPNAKRTSLIHSVWEEVYSYPKWEAVFKGIFGYPPKSAIEEGLETFTEQDAKPGVWGGRSGGESEQHKRLKQHVLENPKILGLVTSDITSRTTEQDLLSGDSADVFFSTVAASYLVEVKSILSSPDDIKRGIYQCLKYRVVLAAQQEKNPDDGSVVARLVTELELPSDLLELARRLNVKTHIVRVNP